MSEKSVHAPGCNRSDEAHFLEEFRRKLEYFFMSPCQKYHERPRKPWKLQIIKIFIITIQLVWFGLSNEMMVRFREENISAFKHFFLKNHKNGLNYYALYTKNEVNDHILFIITRYLHLQNLTVGNHALEERNGSVTPLFICQEFYRKANILPDTFDFDPQTETECMSVYHILNFQKDNSENPLNLTIDFQRLLAINFYLKVKAINVQTVSHLEWPDCYKFSINILFDNRAQSGRIKVSLSSGVEISVCKNWNVSGSTCVHLALIVLFDSVVMICCLLSLILCMRSVYTGFLLQSEYATFMLVHHDKSISCSERMEFINGWNILIIISDMLSIIGSLLKICIQSKNLTNYDVCSILLGTATMLVWTGVMRYLSFSQKYYILIITLRAALPNLIRFAICAVMIYISYCFCGWIVLGPHHPNFRSFDMVADCLFSMINGDEVYSTFTKFQGKGFLLWFFSRVYVYSFIPLFTYMILSVFIAIINDTYETIKHYEKHGAPLSKPQSFIAESKEMMGCKKPVIDEESSCFCCPCVAYVQCKS
ncbi:hypothetical protein DNTS_007116 [Danionella cerebrum]|uniref:Uncharacterized protein n=1 Tax=Danionella cerebrum TaxID=2873325 RepID=A0A553QWB9_9TELE|nr:hypothetical protein DNTS_007116 [Danionella translucida]